MKVTINENCHHTRSCSRSAKPAKPATPARPATPAKRIFCGCSSLQSRGALIFFSSREKKPFKKLETIFLKIRKTSRTENLHFGENFPGRRRRLVFVEPGFGRKMALFVMVRFLWSLVMLCQFVGLPNVSVFNGQGF